MKLITKWNDKMKFTAEADGHSIPMDTKSPVGSDSALTPKQLLVAGVCGCTAMDVVALMRKHKQRVESLEVEADANVGEEKRYPEIYSEIQLRFKVRGEIEEGILLDAVRLSQTKYCSVSAMVSKAVPIHYVVELNGTEIGSGQADFP